VLSRIEFESQPSAGLVELLLERLRPPFSLPVVRVDADDPVFGRGRCGVADCDRTSWALQLCQGHHQRWIQRGKPDPVVFTATTGPIALRAGSDNVDAFDLSALSLQHRLEIAYVLQCRHDDRTVRVIAHTITDLATVLERDGVESFLDRPLEHWLDTAQTLSRGDITRTVALFRYAYERLSDIGGIDIDAEYATDVWQAKRLGIPRARSPHQIRFDDISQPWLRTAVKRWARLRLGSGKTFGTVSVDTRAMVWFSRYLATSATNSAALSREVLERYLVSVTGSHLQPHTASTYITCLRGFLDTCRRHGWLPGLAPTAVLYNDDLPPRPRPLPRFITEFVMAQLENPTNLDRLPDHTTRALVVVITETGLRANDACALVFNPIVNDSSGWPCLRYHNTKMATEQLIPLSPTGAEAIRAQQLHLQQHWPDGPAMLFPAVHSNPDGDRAFNYATLRQRFVCWQQAIGLHDETGQPVSVTPHQFRHTLGTRMINKGVPQHVIQRLLGHASPQMTARYATLHDTTVRAAFDEYCTNRIALDGTRIAYDATSITADAEFTKHNMTRAQASLPNGYCGRPPQQDCPHPNACLTCPDFQTTPAFLDIHRRQRDQTRTLIATAEADGHFRLVDNHQRVHDNLDTLITALEELDTND
jgi:integrase